MKSKSPRLRLSSLEILCASLVVLIVVAWLPSDNFSPDSWSYFELSQSVFDDFYHINTHRQYQIVSDYSTSFPPLYPVLLAVGGKLSSAGIYVGVFLNMVICIATLFLLGRLMQRLGAPGWMAAVLFLGLLLRPEYISELMAARSIPLAIFLLTAILLAYVEPSLITPRRAAVLGVLAGLAVMTRFDFLLSAAVLGLVVGWFTWQRTRVAAAVYFAALAITVSPWILYSATHFSKPFVSDNSRTAMLVSKSHVTDYFPDPQALDFAWESPAAWAKSVVLGRFPRPTIVGLRTVLTDLTLVLLMGMLVGIWLLGRSHVRAPSPDSNRQWIGFSALFVVQLLTIGLTGYVEARYYLGLQFFLSVVLAHAIGRQLEGESMSLAWPTMHRRFVTAACLGCTLMLAAVSALPGWSGRLSGDPGEYGLVARKHSPDEYGEILKAIDSSPRPRVLVVSGVDAFQFGALTGCVTFCKPKNLTPETCVPFVVTYGVTHIIDTEGVLTGDLRESMTLESTTRQGLVKIAAISPDLSPSQPTASNPRMARREGR